MEKRHLKVAIISFSLLFTGCKDNVEVNFTVPNNISENILSETLQPSHKSPLQRKKEANDLREIYSKNSDLWPAPTLDTDPNHGVEFNEIGSLRAIKFPQENQYTPERAFLGRALFVDKRLSGSKSLSCETCHNPKTGWNDNKEFSAGHEGIKLKRNTPSILNVGYNKAFFWDGRAKSLEEQALAVLTSEKEMHSTPESIAETVNNIPIYKKKFKESYNVDNVSINEVTKALATFERTINTKSQSPFDKFINGQKDSMSDSAIRGLNLFRTKARCINCHSGSNFTDNKFHNLSLTYEGTENEDLGRYNITRIEDDWGRFKTPSLRNVEKTAPYQHNGVFLTLNKVLKFYNEGTHGKDPHKSPIIRSLGLGDEDLTDLEEFLKSLSETVPK
ncbi:MAG: c-type cytochrome [Candidatus Sericytochromatia bacterium]|nr:c-type cytochrome [Candidatus Sericytochromatia bacterium]